MVPSRSVSREPRTLLTDLPDRDPLLLVSDVHFRRHPPLPSTPPPHSDPQQATDTASRAYTAGVGETRRSERVNASLKQATHPAKKAATANVAYSAEFAFALVVASSIPPPPNPFSALNSPGPMKHTKPKKNTWITGL